MCGAKLLSRVGNCGNKSNRWHRGMVKIPRPASGDWRTSSPVTPGCVWIVSEAFENGERVIKCLYAAPRSSVYESFQEILLDELTD